MIAIQKYLRNKKDSEVAKSMAIFFKTGPGQYAEGDIFLGCANTPELNFLAKQNNHLTIKEISILLKSKYHEERALGLKILVEKYKKYKLIKDKKKIVKFYLSNTKSINNWDLVDMSAYKIIGDFCLITDNTLIIKKLSRSSVHWEKRIAIVSTYSLIKNKKIKLALELSKFFLKEKEDLMHKACGWMLREVGKRDISSLREFIKMHGKQMPRTMLRYSIEKFPESERKLILLQTKLKINISKPTV